MIDIVPRSEAFEATRKSLAAESRLSALGPGPGGLPIRCRLPTGSPTCPMAFTEFGCGNQVVLSAEAILRNLQAVKQRNLVEANSKFESMDFSVEMETGTGKTYVYLRTLYELNVRYGFTKFVIVVPSVAIREGVLSSLRLTKEHFQALYGNWGVPKRGKDSRAATCREQGGAGFVG